MLKTISLFGLFVAMAAATILFLGTPRTTQVMAREDNARIETCPMIEAVVDEGYGVSRRQLKASCAP